MPDTGGPVAADGAFLRQDSLGCRLALPVATPAANLPPYLN
jgi:hypothetical protein